MPTSSVFGLVTAALERRRDRGVPSFTIVSCDNIEGNGHVAQQAFTDFADKHHPGLSEWMAEHTTFPNSMVDRITPVTTPDVIENLAEQDGVEDRWPVVAEPFTSWALEDHFVDGRPPYEDVGVLTVDDVTPYELMKLRLLNAGHQGLCYFAHLMGYRLVADACSDPLIADLLIRYWDSEATPRCCRCRVSICPLSNAPPSNGSPIPVCATLWPGCAPTPRTAFRNGLCPLSARTWRTTAMFGSQRPSWPAGRATPKAWTSKGTHRGRRSAEGPADPAGPVAEGQSAGVHREHRALRRSRPAAPIRGGLHLGAGLAAP